MRKLCKPHPHPQRRCTINIFHISADGCLPYPSSTYTIFYYYGKNHSDVTNVAVCRNHTAFKGLGI